MVLALPAFAKGVALVKMLSANGVLWRSGHPDCPLATYLCLGGRKLLEPGADNDGHMVSFSPYMADTTFHSNVLVILAALLCAIISVAGLLSMLRCALRCSRHMTGSGEPRHATARLAGTGMKAAAVNALPTVVYGAGAELREMTTDCPICLGEFVAGQSVRVLPNCNHGFHVRCIDTWLRAHSSCPSCRHSLLGLEDNTAKPALPCDSPTGGQTPGSGEAGRQPSESERALTEEMYKAGDSNRGTSNDAAVPIAPSAPVVCAGGTAL